MNKNTLVGIVVVVLIIISGIGYFYTKKTSTAPVERITRNDSSANSPEVIPSIEVKQNSVLNNLSDIFSKRLSLKCQFKYPESTDTTVYIKNGAIAMQLSKSNVIMKDKTMYVWEEGKKEGMTMDFDPTKYTAPTGSANTTQPSGDEKSGIGQFMKELEAYKQSCTPSVVSDSLFTPPPDIKFVDLFNLMKSKSI
ncbi:MAG: hypothetical protein WCO06_05065 [Candidatus Roizmanbacteria bacterium]